MTASSQTPALRIGGRAFAHIAAFHPELTALRRELHAHPELGFEEVYTARRVVEALKVCGVDEIHTGIGKTGVVALVHGREKARAGQTAMLVGAARYLAETRHFAGTAVLIFQPGEEGYAGARAMVQDGLFERFPVQSVYALHNWPALAPGQIGINSGAMMAAADRVTIEITGRGGHGAHPYQTVDPVLVAAHTITAVQSIVSRNVKPVDSAVISLCAVQAGDLSAMSVVPNSASIVGTVRTFKPEVQSLVERRLHDLCMAVAQGFGATAQVTFERMYPATINTAAEAQFAGDVAASIVGEENLTRTLEPSMGAEDFSFMLQAKPGAYLRLGQGTASGPTAQCLHNPGYDFNDDVLPLGSALFAGLVEQGLPLCGVA